MRFGALRSLALAGLALAAACSDANIPTPTGPSAKARGISVGAAHDDDPCIVCSEYSVSIEGPTTLNEGSQGHWTAVSNAPGNSNYFWYRTGNGTPISSYFPDLYYTPVGSGSLQVEVRDPEGTLLAQAMVTYGFTVVRPPTYTALCDPYGNQDACYARFQNGDPLGGRADEVCTFHIDTNMPSEAMGSTYRWFRWDGNQFVLMQTGGSSFARTVPSGVGAELLRVLVTHPLFLGRAGDYVYDIGENLTCNM